MIINEKGKYYLTRVEVCLALDESRATFYRLKHNKALRKNHDFIRKGNRLYYSWEAVRQLLSTMIELVSDELAREWEERMKIVRQKASDDPVPLIPEKCTKEEKKRGVKEKDKNSPPNTESDSPAIKGYQQISFLSGS